jgi:GNAT superfamily N-acetyltransferase
VSRRTEQSSIAIYQATTEEHFELASRLYTEYFRWVAEQFRATLSLDVEDGVEGANERFMATRETLMPPRGRLYLAEYGGEPAATGALKSLAEEDAYLKRMFVRPAYRGRGLSRLVLEQLLGDAREIGYRRVLLETAPFMTAAHRLYRSVGFREREPFLESEVPAEFHELLVFMELDLELDL